MGFEPVFLFVGRNPMDLVKLVDVTVSGMGYELVDVERSGRGLIRVLMDKPEGITVDDCQ